MSRRGPAVKFWEVGAAGSLELEMAAGLFGDVGSPVLQNMLCFTPHGNTLSGTQDGDVFVWSSGTVTAKIEAAHKAEVPPPQPPRRSSTPRVVRVTPSHPSRRPARRVCRTMSRPCRSAEGIRVIPSLSGLLC